MTKRVRGCAKQSVDTLEKVRGDFIPEKTFYIFSEMRFFFVQVISVMPDLSEVANILNRCTLQCEHVDIVYIVLLMVIFQQLCSDD